MSGNEKKNCRDGEGYRRGGDPELKSGLYMEVGIKCKNHFPISTFFKSVLKDNYGWAVGVSNQGVAPEHQQVFTPLQDYGTRTEIYAAVLLCRSARRLMMVT